MMWSVFLEESLSLCRAQHPQGVDAIVGIAGYRIAPYKAVAETDPD